MTRNTTDAHLTSMDAVTAVSVIGLSLTSARYRSERVALPGSENHKRDPSRIDPHSDEADAIALAAAVATYAAEATGAGLLPQAIEVGLDDLLRGLGGDGILELSVTRFQSPLEEGDPVVCADGTLSDSGGIQGACSHHGGEP